MRHFELSTDIRATPDGVWRALVDLSAWPEWNRLVPEAAGVVEPGQRLSFQIRVSPGTFRPHRPTVLVVEPPDRLVLEASFGARWIIHMVHGFHLIPTQEGCRLRQTWETSGILVPLLWSRLRAAQASFAEFGEDVGRYVTAAARSSS